MEIALRGRDFTERDDKEESRVASLMKRLRDASFQGKDAIGRRFNSVSDKPYWEVIGVAADGNTTALARS